MDKFVKICYVEHESTEQLPPVDAKLLEAAMRATETSYSPYSHFRVGAALLLADDSIVTGSNQENMAYPSGLCAERTAMFAAGAQHPGVAFKALAIVGRDSQDEWTSASPCGACRQVMAEYERLGGSPLRLLLLQKGGKVLEVKGTDSLLPFSFSM
ncbi:MAG: cytidine deaminase [Bacteroidales bacterium]|nr:cytidine deaminase [Bacteroidales bacterium]